MRLFFLGQGPLGERVFKFLIAAPNSSVAVVGAASNVNAGNVWWRSADILECCRQASLPFVPNDRKNEQLLIRQLINTEAQWILSVQHPWVLSPRVLNAVQGRAINLHTAPLPEYGGFNGISHALLEGATAFGVTLHWAVELVDSGPVITREMFTVPESATASSLHRLTVDAGYRLLTAFVSHPDEWYDSLPRIGETTPCRFFKRSELERHREIKDLGNEFEIQTKARAFYFPPFPPAFASIAGSKFFIIPNDKEAACAR
jgi:methionyl-tRNA formyltransferase